MTRYASELCSALSALSGSSRVITLDRPLQRPYLSRLFNHRQTRRLDAAWSRYVVYPRSLRRRTADVFHVMDQAEAHLVRSLDPERTVVTCHDLIPLLAAEGVIPIRIPATVVRTFRWRIAHLARARRVIVDSEATKAALERYTSVAPEHIAVVPLGVSPTFRTIPDAGSATRGSAGVSDTAIVVLQVASAGRYKNTPTLLHAFAGLRSRLPADVILVRIGAPFYPDEEALAEQLGLAASIRYIGHVDDRTLASWYNAADLLVFPSLWEGFGWPPLEAMACGTPVVASNVPAIAEVVGDAGLLVPARDPAAVADAAEQVLTDPARAARMRERGLARARQFTWARAAAGTLAVYDAILG
jgi:glycosyltransferase involved in cell wall biosynthesis